MIGVNKMVYSIENDSLYVSVELKGAQLKSIYSKDSKIEYLWQGDSAFWAGRAYNLFPYVGRLAGGKYVVEGKEYAMDRHGFARGMQFCLTEKSDNSMTFAICSTEETKKIYPFDFILKVTFTILGKKLKNCEEVQEVSIIPRGMAAGYTMSRPDSDDNHLTLGKLNDEIAMIMGGRIAEELFMDDISTGASNDIQKATDIARRMVTQWGMSKKFGFMNLGSSEEIFVGRDYRTKNNYSEKTFSEVDAEIQKILKANYERAKDIIEANKDVLVEMAEILLVKETIYTEEVDMILAGKSKEEVIDYMDKKLAEQKEKDEKLKKEQELFIQLAELEQKMKTAEFYLKEGKISQKDFDRIVAAKKEMMQEIENVKALSEEEKNEEEN